MPRSSAELSTQPCAGLRSPVRIASQCRLVRIDFMVRRARLLWREPQSPEGAHCTQHNRQAALTPSAGRPARGKMLLRCRGIEGLPNIGPCSSQPRSDFGSWLLRSHDLHLGFYTSGQRALALVRFPGGRQVERPDRRKSMQIPAAPSSTAKGFFSSLFDTSFSSLIATRVIKVAYLIAIVIISLEAVGFLVAALESKNAEVIVGAIILIPIVWVLTLIWIRILLELVIVIFRIGEDVRRISLSSVLAGLDQTVSLASAEVLAGSSVTPTDIRTTPSHVESPGQEPSSRPAPEPGDTPSLIATQEVPPTKERPAAGWYQDPEHEGYARFWSGESWTDQRRPIDSFGGQ